MTTKLRISGPKERFEKLVEEWRNATEFCSSITDICTHRAYQQIIGMGETALPFIFQELECEPDHWFWALNAITGDDPVPHEHRGDLGLMRQDWLNWKRDKGYFWS